MENLVLAVIIGALIGIIYSLRRIFVLERRISNIEKSIMKSVVQKKSSKKRR